MFNNHKAAKAVRLALVFGAASTAMFTASNAVAAEEDDAKKVERIEVTGSRIKRTDIEGASPIEVITFDNLKDQGRLSVTDALQSLTNNSFGADLPESGSGAQSQSTLNLLGLGAGRTLILLDGKRLAGSPSLGGSTANLSSIPAAAVERIEILKDGASAVYGSDAIGGVVNIILKNKYEGVSFDAGIGRTEKGGADTRNISFTTGVASEKGSMTFVFDHMTQGELSDGAREHTKPWARDLNGDGLISHGDETFGMNQFGATITNPTTKAFEASPLCETLMKDNPGQFMKLDQGTALGGIGKGTVCAYLHNNVSVNKASTKRNAIMTSGEYQVSEDVEVYFRSMFSKNDSFGRYAAPAAFYANIPVGDPANPYNVVLTGSNPFRWVGIGPRANFIEDFQQDHIVGAKGLIADKFDWEVSYHRGVLDYHNAGRSYLSVAGLVYNNTNKIPNGSPTGQKNLSATTYRKNENIFDHYYAGVGFEHLELAGGAVSHFIGVERYETIYRSIFDKQSEAGLIGGSAGNSAQGERQNNAYFYEIGLPFSDQVLVSGAYRFDSYSDVGSKGVPSLKIEYRPIDDLLVRGSASKGFRAASLSQLLAQDAEGNPTVTDYGRCKQAGITFDKCPSAQQLTLYKSNSNLAPESSTYLNIGLVYSGVENLTAKLDLFDVEVTGVIGTPDTQDLIYAELAGKLPEMQKKYPGIVFTRNAQGALNNVVTSSYNGAVLGRTGADLELTYRLPTSFGDFNLRSQTTYLFEVLGDTYFGGPSQDFGAFTGTPEWRSQFSVGYTIEDLAINWTTDVIGDTGNRNFPVVTGTSVKMTTTGHYGTYTTHNLTATYFTGLGNFTAGARNLFNKDVTFDSTGKWNDDNLYIRGHYGRELFINYGIKF